MVLAAYHQTNKWLLYMSWFNVHHGYIVSYRAATAALRGVPRGGWARPDLRGENPGPGVIGDPRGYPRKFMKHFG
jgi:hypothetical protein